MGWIDVYKRQGQYYTFVDGRMQTGWYKLPVQAAAESGEAQTATPSEAAPASEQTAAGYQYYDCLLYTSCVGQT